MNHQFQRYLINYYVCSKKNFHSYQVSRSNDISVSLEGSLLAKIWLYLHHKMSRMDGQCQDKVFFKFSSFPRDEEDGSAAGLNKDFISAALIKFCQTTKGQATQPGIFTTTFK